MNFYQLLGIRRDASAEEIRRAYHEMARRLHPDMNEEEGATEKFLEVQRAYEVLSDPHQRRAYDLGLPPESSYLKPVKLNLQFSQTSLYNLTETQAIYALLELTPETNLAPAPAPPINACLVIDRSTSMQGERMDTVKSSAIEILRRTRPEDALSIVAFGDRADVLLSSGQRIDRETIETQIHMLRTGGGTEILKGLEAALFEVRRNLSKSRVNHIILLTDGRTYGDEEACLNLATQAANQGIRITGLGIGAEWNDEFLDTLAGRTGGSCFYVSKASDIRRFLEETFLNLSQIFADNVQIQMQVAAGVHLSYAYRVQPDSGPLSLDLPLLLGSISQKTPMSILFELLIDPLPRTTQHFMLASGQVTLSLPQMSISSAILPFQILLPVSPLVQTSTPPEVVLQAAAMVNVYRMQERARQEAAAGRPLEASLRLQQMATHLLAQGRSDLARTTLLEAEHLQKNSSFSEEGEKRLKYGTRALLLPAGLAGGKP